MIYFITGNPGKVREVQAILGDIEVKQLDIDLPEIQEIDPHKIIGAKLAEARKHHSAAMFVEDTSLYLDALGGKLPGPLIKWFMKSIGNDGIVKLVQNFGMSGARASNLIGFADEYGDIQFFEGSTEGKIVEQRGDDGFGWDPIFQPVGHGKTYAEMTLEEKNEVSHRRKSIDKFRGFLEKR